MFLCVFVSFEKYLRVKVRRGKRPFEVHSCGKHIFYEIDFSYFYICHKYVLCPLAIAGAGAASCAGVRLTRFFTVFHANELFTR